MLKIRILNIIILSFTFLSLNAQKYHFENYNIEDGLMQASVKAIYISPPLAAIVNETSLKSPNACVAKLPNLPFIG